MYVCVSPFRSTKTSRCELNKRPHLIQLYLSLSLSFHPMSYNNNNNKMKGPGNKPVQRGAEEKAQAPVNSSLSQGQ